MRKEIKKTVNDIEILENYIRKWHSTDVAQAIETILKERQEDKEKIKELEENNKNPKKDNNNDIILQQIFNALYNEGTKSKLDVLLSNSVSELNKKDKIIKRVCKECNQEERKNKQLNEDNLAYEIENSQLGIENRLLNKTIDKAVALIAFLNSKHGCYLGKNGLVERCKGMTWCEDCIKNYLTNLVEREDK